MTNPTVDLRTPLQVIARRLGLNYSQISLFELGPSTARVTLLKHHEGKPFVATNGEVATEVHTFRIST